MNRSRTALTLLLAAAALVWLAAPAAALAAGGHEAEPVNQNPLEWRSDLAIWTFVVFVILLGVLWKFAWGPIIEGLNRREKHIAGQIAEAEQRNAEARRREEEYQRRLEASADEARQIIAEARRRAEEQGREIVAQAKGDAEAEVRRAKQEIQSASDAALKELAEQSATMAVQLAGRIVGRTLTPSDHAQLIAQAVAGVAERKPSVN